jgi:outer membrane protein
MTRIIKLTLLQVIMVGTAIAHDKLNTLKIGIVNPISVYQDSPQGQSSIKALQNSLKPKANELQDEQNSLVKKIKLLQTNSPTMTQTDLNEQKDKLYQERETLQKKISNFKQSEMLQEQRIVRSFQDKFGDSIYEVAKKHGYQLILSSQGIAYASPSFKLKNDTTHDVLAKMRELN